MVRITLAMLLVLLTFGLTAIRAQDAKPIKVLIITGDHGHDWKATTPILNETLTKAGMKVDVID